MSATVLITGASLGSGKATALLFARKGYNVVLAARSADKLEAAAEEVRSLGGSAVAIATDVTDFQQVENLERAQFRGQNEAEIESRRQQMTQMLQSSIVSQPEDIAKAIWHGVSQKQTDVVVGPAVVATEAYRLCPGLVQFIMGKS